MSEPTESPADESAANKKFLESIDALGRTLKLPDGFLWHLIRSDDDWSFVVKAHALLESAVCAWLAAHLRKPELEAALTEVEMSARLELMSALNLSTSIDRGSMRALGKLRNTLAHSAKGTQFTFAQHLSNGDRRRTAIEQFGLRDSLASAPVPSNVELGYRLRIRIWGLVVLALAETVTERSRPTPEELQRIQVQAFRDALIRRLDNDSEEAEST
jgi:hypothetical protein